MDKKTVDFIQSQNYRCLNLPADKDSLRKKPLKCFYKVIFWVIFLIIALFLIFLYLKYSIFGRKLKNEQQFRTEHSPFSHFDLEPINIGNPSKVTVHKTKCDNKNKNCDYSDIINDVLIDQVFESISKGQYEEINTILKSYIFPLEEKSESPYKNETIWIQNFNNMQKVFEPQYWIEIHALMTAIKEKHNELAKIRRIVFNETVLFKEHQKSTTDLEIKIENYKNNISDFSIQIKSKKEILEKEKAILSANEKKLESLNDKISHFKVEKNAKINNLNAEIEKIRAFENFQIEKTKQQSRNQQELEQVLIIISLLERKIQNNELEKEDLSTKLKSEENLLEEHRLKKSSLDKKHRFHELRLKLLRTNLNFAEIMRNLVNLDKQSPPNFQNIFNEQSKSIEGFDIFLNKIRPEILSNTTLSEIDATEKKVHFLWEQDKSILDSSYKHYSSIAEFVDKYQHKQQEVDIVMRKREQTFQEQEKNNFNIDKSMKLLSKIDSQIKTIESAIFNENEILEKERKKTKSLQKMISDFDKNKTESPLSISDLQNQILKIENGFIVF